MTQLSSTSWQGWITVREYQFKNKKIYVASTFPIISIAGTDQIHRNNQIPIKILGSV